ncbi:DUF1186 domain-containing protein [Nodularia sp. LEGE 04288]|uniref:DUF1186 domain-containing protein n=1 Tax=Nodularia sp. LEGE 04288 TaxID=1828639 RepID=UPI001D125136|nr:DUF1186 domain-containing protein [Nodularia sp. LEGE 04288]MCC2693912.1 DUF1186 domain-containing protein [Nodularia sp. LEGE 04288]
MQLEEILSELENNTNKFPRLALERAIEEREAITPILLSTLEKLSSNLEELVEKEEYTLHLYALYLLAQFKEPLAYPVIIKFFSVPGEMALDVTGDIVTEDLCRILASVSDGNIEPIKQLIENEEINEYVRGAALESLLVLVALEVISREQVIQYHAELFSNKVWKEDDYIWTKLVINSAKLCAVELKEQIDKVFAEDLVDLFFINEEDVNDGLQVGIEAALIKLRENPRYSFIEDVISETRDWAAFHPERFQQLDNRLINPEGFSSYIPKKGKNQAKKKKKIQEQSRRKNRANKK